jgi:hypothetical protein
MQAAFTGVSRNYKMMSYTVSSTTSSTNRMFMTKDA